MSASPNPVGKLSPTVSGRPVPAARSRSLRPDVTTIAGLVIGLGGILAGLLLEGGTLQEITRPTAALIVFGGTLGALLLTTPFRVLKIAAARLSTVFFEHRQSPEELIESLIVLATKARKEGIVSLESELGKTQDPFLAKALEFAVDGVDGKELRSMMELEIQLEQAQSEEAARVFTAAGGYAPTIGIIGAVLGLMQVMKNLSNIEDVGRGIATAFVATIYGVGSANLIFLPIGNRIRSQIHARRQLRELTLKGAISIVEGMNPRLTRSMLEAYVRHWTAGGTVRAGGSSATFGGISPRRATTRPALPQEGLGTRNG